MPARSNGVPPEFVDHPRYRVLSLLGEGGMGTVYKAQHLHMDRLVALKVLRRALLGGLGPGDLMRRFGREVRAAASLNHPNVVAAYDADGLFFLVLEYVEGRNLADEVRDRGPLPVAEACDAARQAALVLQHACDKGLVHRDVKPHNLIRTADGVIKVLDFGLAQIAGRLDPPCGAPASESGAPESGALTVAGAVMGTADYMAPEQAADAHQADIRADLYSLGCTLYQLLTGRVPFPGGAALEKLARHAADRPDDLRRLRPDVPKGLAAVVERLMAKKPDDRYPTSAEAAAALAPFAAAPRRRRSFWLLAAARAAGLIAPAAAGRRAWRRPLFAAALALLLVLSLAPFYLLPRRPDPTDEAGGSAADIAALAADGRRLLAEESFHLAQRQLSAAVALSDGRPDALSPADRRDLLQLQRQADLLARLSSRPLEEIVQDAARTRREDEWRERFTAEYQGRAVLFDDAVCRDDLGRPALSTYKVHIDDETARVALEDVKALRDLPLERPRRALFGARLAAVGREDGGGWVVRFDPDSGVLLTDRGAAAVLGPLDADSDEVLKRQAEWLK
jgi:hypothetical protein